jgi:putative component of membrane protein insertase Oxa1/YidC/SpoIIIJ protein YidD
MLTCNGIRHSVSTGIVSIMLLCYCLFSNYSCLSQNSSIHRHFITHRFQPLSNGTLPHREFIAHQGVRKPSHVFSGALIYFYQNMLSEQIQADCTYEVTCSQWIKHGIERYGFWKGVLLGLNQYTSCVGANNLGSSPCRINNDGKVINRISDEDL